MNYMNKTAAMSGNMGQNADQTPDYFPIAMAYVPGRSGSSPIRWSRALTGEPFSRSLICRLLWGGACK